MPTISDVAKLAGVSTYTVSAVLNHSAKVSPELTGRVLKAVNELDYTINYVARSLQTRKTETIGMLVPDLGNPAHSQVLKGVEDVCRERRYSLFLGSTHNRLDDLHNGLNVYRAKQVDGILLFRAGDEAPLEALRQKKIPVVCLDRRPGTFDGDYVIADRHLAARIATGHLASKGHRAIAILSTGAEAIEGWRAGLDERSLAAAGEFALEVEPGAESAYRAASRLLSLAQPPSAILAANAAMVAGVLRAARERSLKVPEQLEIMSASDSEWLDALEPPISAVCQSRYEMGAEAARLLFRRIAEPGRAFEHIVLPVSLKIR